MEQQLSFSEYIFSTGIISENTIFFFSECENVLMEIDLKDWHIRYSYKINECNSLCLSRANYLICTESKIYKLVLDGSVIEEVSLKNGVYKNIPLGYYDKEWDNFVAFELYDQFLYVFPKWSKKVIKINLQNYKKTEIVILNKNVKSGSFVENFTNFMTAVRVKDCIWLFEAESHRVYIFDMGKDTYKFCMLPNEISDCIWSCQNDKVFYILTSYGQVYLWNPELEEYTLVWKGEEKYGHTTYYFGQIIYVCQKIIMLPCVGEDIVIIDIKNGDYFCYDNYPEDFFYLDIKWGKYCNYFEDSDNIYYPMRLSNYMMVINKGSGKIYWKKLIMPSKIDKLKFKVANKHILDDDVEDLLECCKTKENVSILNKQCVIGINIWQKLKFP